MTRRTRFAVLVPFLLAICLDLDAAAQGRGAAPRAQARIILDTDIDTDVDDLGAVAVLHALADRGEAAILAMGVSSTNPMSAPCLAAINTYYGRGDIAIGTLKGAGVPSGESKHCQRIADEFPHALKSGQDAVDVVELYRRVLAAQPDRSVVMVSDGFLTNLASLLRSRADANSPLSGVDLVRLKVKAWVCMGGNMPSGPGEWNFDRDEAATQFTIRTWPTPVVFSGFELGAQIFTGARLAETPAVNPVRRGYEVFNGLKNRESWDQTAVLYAVRGLDGALDDVWARSHRGEVRISVDGAREFVPTADGAHAYLLPKMEVPAVAQMIDALMVQPPRRQTIKK